MEESLKQKVAAALAEACMPEDESPDIQLDDTGNHIGGLVVSASFAGKSPHERQDRIWRLLDEHLSPHERTRISFILTETPEEHRALADGA